LGAGPSQPTGNWPLWRGPLATGEAPGGDPPIEFGEGSNVKWKTAIPGSGASTPIVWSDTIYLQASSEVGPEKAPRQTSFAFAEERKVYKGATYTRATRDHEFALVAVDRASGGTRWRKVLHVEQPHEGRHP